MADQTAISWCHHTFNPWRGCTKVSDGCKFCYADTLSKRNPTTLGIWGPKGTRPIAADAYWLQPLKWNAEAKAAGERRRVFCASLADVFEGPETMPAEAIESVQFARLELFALIHGTPHLDWLILTKRPENAVLFFRKETEEFIMAARNRLSGTKRHAIYEASVSLGLSHFPNWKNVWLGTSVEDQKAADERIPHLLKIPAKVRFLSCEPLLGPVDLRRWLCGAHPSGLPFGYCTLCNSPKGYPESHDEGHGACLNSECEAAHEDKASVSFKKPFHWVICGGETGVGARAMEPSWPRALRDECEAAGVPFHFKQVGEWDTYEHVRDHEWRSAYSGAYIDGNSFPDFGDERASAGWDSDIEGCFVGRRTGTRRTGRLLDGVPHDAFPEVAHV